MIERLSREQALALLSGRVWRGFLAVVDDGRPYCFPVAHVVYGENLYFLFTKYGRKIRAIERNNNVCYACLEKIENMYISIIVEGTLHKENDTNILRTVIQKFIKDIFPRDPYFRGFCTGEDEILTMISTGQIPGVYKLLIENIDTIVVHE